MDRVAYKPLGTSPPNGDGEAECELDEATIASNYHNHYKHYGVFSTTIMGHYFGLRQLRILLYLVAILLFLIFVIQLTTSSSHESRHLNSGATIRSLPATSSDKEQQLDPSNSSNKLPTPKAQESSLQGLSTSVDKPPSTSSKSHDVDNNGRPEYDSYLSSVLHERNSHSGQTATKESIDDLHIPISDEHYNNNKSANSPLVITTTATPLKVEKWWLPSIRHKYVTISNYIRAMKSFSYNSSLTLTTQATTEFMYHTLELCKRWDGPISVAVFSPGVEMQVALTLIKFMRHCLPGPLSACIRDKVSWHLVYNMAHGPSDISYPKHHLDFQHFPLFVHQDQCPKFPGPEPDDSIRQFEEELRRLNGIYPKTYRQQFQLPYPINVLRNTARLAAKTRYILASDIELYPSINLVPSFVNSFLTKNEHRIREQYNIEKYVFTLPIFEVKSNITAPPKTKSELVKMISHGDAVFFHKYVCDACQNFPNRLDWLETDKQELEYYHSSEQENELVVFEKTQRDKNRDSWEPIFIGTNEDPLYDDRLTWDGRRDKMAQMYEMCLQNYHLLVLGNAFLVHAPGIKHIDKNDTMKRLKYIRENNAIYDTTMAKLKQQYITSGNIEKC